jgi:dimethylhistidine N-methyltransferase
MPDDSPNRLAAFHDLEPALEDFGAAVIAGLASTPKTLPCKFFYDQKGSQIFDQICDLAEYYPTRTEIGLLEAKSAEMAELFGPACHVIEFGSGSSVKIRILLGALDAPAGYTALDISRDHLLQAAESLAVAYPDVPVAAVCADFTRPFDLPDVFEGAARRLGFFPGSSIGNFTRVEAAGFLEASRKILTGPDAGFLVGVDLRKDPAILNAAYNDAKGVTAAFNLNLLTRANRELGADFDLDGFRHHAFYNEDEGRVEMHLISTRAQEVSIGERRFSFVADETIHTENSYKYAPEEFQDIARTAGYRAERLWIDENQLFSLHYLLVDG